MKKKLFATLLAMTLAVTTAATVPATPSAQAKTSSIKKTAEKALAAKAEELAVKAAKKYDMPTEYGMYDMNKDGVPELIFGYIGNREGIEVYRYDKKNKKVVQAKLPKSQRTDGSSDLSGVVQIKKEKKGMTLIAAGSAYDSAIVTYTLNESGNLQSSNAYIADYRAKKFTKDGEKISKAAYEKYGDKVAKKPNLKHNTTVPEADRLVSQASLGYLLHTYNLSEIFADYQEYTTYDVSLQTYDLKGNPSGSPLRASFKKGAGFDPSATIGKFALNDMKLLDTEELDTMSDDLRISGAEYANTTLRISNLDTITAGRVALPAGADPQNYTLLGQYFITNYGDNLESATFSLQNNTTGETTIVASYTFERAVG